MKAALYAAGSILMASPGLFKTETRLWFFGCMGAGCVLFIIATVEHGVTKPRTALLLLIISTITTWLSFALWLIRDRLLGPLPPFSGEDPFGIELALWCLLLIPVAIYEVVVFLWGLIANRERRAAAVGLAAVVGQTVPIFGLIYLWARAS
jgi:hypothetical protein